jgi:hypothetical protein
MFFIKAIEGEDYASMLPDWRRDADTDAMKVRVFLAVSNLQPAEFDGYLEMVREGRERQVFLAEPQSGMES